MNFRPTYGPHKRRRTRATPDLGVIQYRSAIEMMSLPDSLRIKAMRRRTCPPLVRSWRDLPSLVSHRGNLESPGSSPFHGTLCRRGLVGVRFHVSAVREQQTGPELQSDLGAVESTSATSSIARSSEHLSDGSSDIITRQDAQSLSLISRPHSLRRSKHLYHLVSVVNLLTKADVIK
mgnify:CR=1 FL=1